MPPPSEGRHPNTAESHGNPPDPPTAPPPRAKKLLLLVLLLYGVGAVAVAVGVE